MSAEICGVLIGAANGQTTVVEASIEGEEARQGGSHVTFTQDTWTHIYQVKDSQYPDKRIVGWYHSHPGFGVFLSEHDTFIHRNFFSNANQVAWVFDPHSDEEGCFAWHGDEIVRVAELAIRNPKPSGAAPAVGGRSPDAAHSPEPKAGDSREPDDPPGESRRGRAARWIGLTMSHILVLLAGFVIGYLVAPPIVVAPDRGQRPEIAAPAPHAEPPAAREDQKK